MARPRSEFLSSLGKLFAIFKKVVDQVLDIGGNDDDVARVNSEDGLARDVAELITGRSLAVPIYTSHEERARDGKHFTLLWTGNYILAVTDEDAREEDYIARTSKARTWLRVGDQVVIYGTEGKKELKIDRFECPTETGEVHIFGHYPAESFDSHGDREFLFDQVVAGFSGEKRTYETWITGTNEYQVKRKLGQI